MVKLKIAIATDGKNKLDDEVSKVFGRANTFTVVTKENTKVTEIKVIENSAVSYHHGAGPIAVKTLIDEGVNIVLANELGFGASELLKQHNVKFLSVKPGTKVQDAIKEVFENTE